MKQFAPAFSLLCLLAFAAQSNGEVTDSGSSILGKSILAPLELEPPPIAKSDSVATPSIANHGDAVQQPVAVQPKAPLANAPSLGHGASQSIGPRPRPTLSRKGLLQRLEAQWRKRSWRRKTR